MNIGNNQIDSQLLREELQDTSDKILISNNIFKKSKSPEVKHIKKSKGQIEFSNYNQSQTSMISLNKSNISVQKIKFNKKNYEEYMFQKQYLLSKTQYHKIILVLSELEDKIKDNNQYIENTNKSLNKLKEKKKQKKVEIIELLSNKETLEEIYHEKISSLNDEIRINKEKNDNINGKIRNIENINDIAEEQTNPNTNDSNNSNDENKNNENDNESHKKKESYSSSLSSDNINQIEIKSDEIKICDIKKFEEQVNSLTELFLQKKDEELSNKLKKKVNLSYQAFCAETNSLENDDQNSTTNFFSRISSFISNQSVGNISEKIVNSYLRDLMKINSLGEKISEILNFLNKKYKDSKKELKQKLQMLLEKNENFNVKKKSFETKKKELKQFMEENKDKYNKEKSQISLGHDNKSLVSFISDNNNYKDKRIIFKYQKGFNQNSLKLRKLSFKSLNTSKNNIINLENNENNDWNNSGDNKPNTDRQIVDNLNKYLINSFQINKNKKKEKSVEKANKKIILHKNSLNKISLNINNLLINNINKQEDKIIGNQIHFINNNIDAMNKTQNIINNKRINTKIIYRNSKIKNEGLKPKSDVFYNSNTNYSELLNKIKKPNINKIIFLNKEMKSSNSFRNLNLKKSPPKITQTHRHNHIFFQREELTEQTFSKSPDNIYNNKRYTNKTNNIPYQGKIIALNKDKRIDISRFDKDNIYSTRYDNRLKLLTKGIKESFCYFKFYGENHMEFNPLDELLTTPENLDYIEGYISIDVFLHKFKVIPKIYRNKKINFEQLVNILNKEINIDELKSEYDSEYMDGSFLGIELKDIIDIVLSKEMKDIIKVYSAYAKYSERQEKPDIIQFINTKEIRDISLYRNEKMKAAFCKYFIFSLNFKKKSSPKIEFIFINYEQFNLWYNCLQYIIKINNQTPKLINTKSYNINLNPDKKES